MRTVPKATPNRVLAIVVSGLVVVAVVAAVLAATRSSTTVAPGTPQAAVQGYLEAVLDGDADRAAGFLAPGSECTAADLDRAGVPDSTRVTLVSSTTDGSTARVKVQVSFGSGGPFDDGRSETQTFRLEQSAGQWRLSGIPWPLFDCGVSSP
jgi:hypothetical protein